MTTRALLRDRIVHDLERSDLVQQVNEAIGDAIDFHQAERFYFNEARSVTFATVAAQREYTSTAIAGLIKLDEVLATVSGAARILRSMDPVVMELHHDTGISTGPPTSWSYYNQGISLYPLPDDAYTVRLLGHLKIAAPATDEEEGNPWMTEAFELIRASAKVFMAAHFFPDGDLGQRAAAMEGRALDKLRRETSRRLGRGRLVPTCW